MSHWTGLLGKLIVVSLLAGLLAAACGGGEEAPPVPTPTSVAVATPTTPPVAPSPTPVVVVPTPTRAPTPTPAPVVKRGGTLKLRTASDPAPWAPHGVTPGNSLVVWPPVLGALVQTTFPGTDIVGDLAESWTVSQDGKVITFKLLKGVTWHDGKPLVASDIRFNLERVFFGAGGYVSHLRPFFSAVQGVEAVDDATLKITLKQPSNSFMTNMTHGLMLNIAPHVPDAEREKGKVIGTGAFIWERWDSGVSVIMKRNPSFYRTGVDGKPLPYLDGLKYFIIPDTAAHLAAFRTGQVDIYDSLNPGGLIGKIEALKQAMPGLEARLGTGGSWRTLFLKNEAGLPFTDINVRKAFQYGLDRQKFVDVAWEGLGYINGLANWVPEQGGKWAPSLSELKQLPGMNPDKVAQDQATAKELLAKAGFGPTNKLKAEMPVISVGTFADEAVVVVALYRELGIELTVKPETGGDQNRRLLVGLKGNYQTLFRPFAMAVDDPSQTIGTFWTSDAARNYSGWHDSQVDQWYQEQETTSDPARRAKLVKDALLRIYDQAYDIVVSYNTGWSVKRLDIKNYTPGGAYENHWRYESLWIDR